MNPAITLAEWIMETCPYRYPMTHLKLQKLLFYCVGTAMAFDVDAALGGPVLFQPWKHGPVNKDVWLAFKEYGGDAIPTPQPSPYRTYPASVERPMKWALQIYGALDAWSLRQQSHMEQPWIDACKEMHRHIPADAIRTHFKKKFTSRRVMAPEHLQDPGTFKIDRIPVVGYSSMEELAESVYSIYGNDDRQTVP
ncbi:Panacea domain-containing protein [Sorangium sp. So ce117]|uniref:Panacea domain-containing protein n=1 Tax=Sorangium sp. So ce117 TaxID=3133277 RepID=UPI003F5E8239